MSFLLWFMLFAILCMLIAQDNDRRTRRRRKQQKREAERQIFARPLTPMQAMLAQIFEASRQEAKTQPALQPPTIDVTPIDLDKRRSRDAQQ